MEFGIVDDDGENLFFLDNIGTGVEHFTRITEEEALALGEVSGFGNISRILYMHARAQYYRVLVCVCTR